MVRVRVEYSDGKCRGGLLTLEHCIGRPMWHAPPNPSYHESLVRYDDDSWLLVRLSTSPKYDRPESDVDAFDENSNAVRLSNADTLRWFERQGMRPPHNLFSRLIEHKHISLAEIFGETSPGAVPCDDDVEGRVVGECEVPDPQAKAEAAHGDQANSKSSEPAVGPAAPTHRKMVVSFQLEEERGLKLNIRVENAPDEARSVFQVRGPTRARVAYMVFSQPGQDHTWLALLKAGLHAGYWKNTSQDTIRRQASRIVEALPSYLKGYWSQSSTGVRWESP